MNTVRKLIVRAPMVGWSTVTLALLAVLWPETIHFVAMPMFMAIFLVAIALHLVAFGREMGISTATTSLYRNRDLLFYAQSWRGYDRRLIYPGLVSLLIFAAYVFGGFKATSGAAPVLLAFGNLAFLGAAVRFSREWPGRPDRPLTQSSAPRTEG